MSNDDRRRVLHLLDASSDAATRRAVCYRDLDAWDGAVECCRVLADRLSDWDHEVIVIGNGDDERRIERVLGGDPARVAPPARRRQLAWRGVRHAVAELGGCDVALCWSSRAAELADRALPDTGTVVIGGAPVVNAAGVDRALVFDNRDGEGWAPLGVRWETVTIPVCARTGGATREQIRTELGVEPGSRVVVVAHDPPAGGDANRAVFTHGILMLQDEDATMIAPRRSAQFERGVALHDNARLPWPLIETDLPLAELLPAADIGLAAPLRCDARADGRLQAMIRRFHAAGVPVVSVDGPWAEALYGDARADCCCPNPAPSSLVRGMMRIWGTDDYERVSRIVRERATAGDPDGAFAEQVERALLAAIREGMPVG